MPVLGDSGPSLLVNRIRFSCALYFDASYLAIGRHFNKGVVVHLLYTVFRDQRHT